jgi:hypothetical protein
MALKGLLLVLLSQRLCSEKQRARCGKSVLVHPRRLYSKFWVERMCAASAQSWTLAVPFCLNFF